MCTALSIHLNDMYIGRTLDNEVSFGKKVTFTPRNYPFVFQNGKKMNSHYAILGMASVIDSYPLYFDAINEKGIGVIGLNFVGNAHYFPRKETKDNIAPYEFIPCILSQCKNMKEVRKLLSNLNFYNHRFKKNLALARQHYLISNGKESITVEPTKDGLKIYKNKVGVLTNNPPFDMQVFNLNSYINLTNLQPENRFAEELNLENYSKGMGALGLPGDNSSLSRFVRVAFHRFHSVSFALEEDNMNQFYHVLSSVNQVKGVSKTAEDKYETTLYMSCCNLTKGYYSYKTYLNNTIRKVSFLQCYLTGDKIRQFDDIDTPKTISLV